LKIEQIRKQIGHDCWGNYEYDDFYIVTDDNGKVIYESKDDPTKLIEYIKTLN
jgi:hypothetical protein